MKVLTDHRRKKQQLSQLNKHCGTKMRFNTIIA